MPEEQGAAPDARFSCSHPGCTKSFLRKEHRNRHFRSHGSSRPHKCYICNRSFARSDILTRHVLQHNVPPEETKRTVLACQLCRKRKIKCDSDDPCSNCSSSNKPCVRQASSMQSSRRDLAEKIVGRTEAEAEVEQEDNGSSSDFESEVDMSDRGELQDGEQWDADTPTNKNASGGDFDAGQKTLASDISQSPPGHYEFPSSSSPYANVDDSGFGARSISHATNSSLITLNSEFSSTNNCQLEISNDRAFHSSLDPNIPTLDPSLPLIGNDAGKFPKCMYSSLANELYRPADSLYLPLAAAPSNPEHIATPQYQEVPNGKFDFTNLKTLPSFLRFHQDWPLLHVPTFPADKCTTLLSSALINVTGWLQDINRHHLIPYGINDMLIKSLMPKVTDEVRSRNDASTFSLQTLQALVITISYALLCDSPQVTINWAVQWCDIAISMFRQLGILANRWTPVDADNYEVDRWLVEDQTRRLVYAILRLDAYLSIITGRAPVLRFQEIRIPLPVSEDLWNEPSHEGRLKLHWKQSAGRAKLTFHEMMRHGLLSIGPLKLPLELSQEDYHFGLCALQSEIWTASQEARCHDHRTYKSPCRSSSEEVRVWYNYLLEWRSHVEQNHHLERHFFANDPVPLDSKILVHANAGLNLTLYHISVINLHANVHLLETRKCCSECTEPDISHRIQNWTQSQHGRRAVLHAAQLQRVHECESSKLPVLSGGPRLLHNVLSPTGLLTSALVICVQSVQSPGCTSCTATQPADTDSVELAQSDSETTGACQHWVENGGQATVNGVPLCLCSVPKLSSWYRERLKGSPSHEQRLIRFLLGLNAL